MSEATKMRLTRLLVRAGHNIQACGAMVSGSIYRYNYEMAFDLMDKELYGDAITWLRSLRQFIY